MGWTSALPEPVLEGNTATYVDVFPDVDLRVTVTSTAVSHVLVVHTKGASTNPALTALDLPIEVEGGTVAENTSGGIRIADANGEMVAGSPEPIMWDSSGGAKQAAPGKPATDAEARQKDRAAAPTDGDEISSLDTEVTPNKIRLKPKADALRGPNVTYPVYIDPTLTWAPKAWTMVFKEYPNTEFYGWDGNGRGEGVGFQNEDGRSTKRLFWNFKSTEFAGATVFGAQFRAKLMFSWSCTKTNVQAWRTKPINSGTNWSNQPAFVDSNHQDTIAAAGGRTGCVDEPWLEFNVTKGMKAVAAAKETYATFALKAPPSLEDGTDPSGWKRFAKAAELTVTYGFAPNTPTGLGMTSPSMACGATFGPDAPYLAATLSDRNNEHLSAHFEFTGTGIIGTRLISTASKSPTTRYLTPSEAPVAKSATGDPVSGSYSWRVRAKDALGLYGPWSPACTFTIDATRPKPPTVDFPEDANLSFGGGGATATIGPNGSTDVSKYGWSLGSNEPQYSVAAGTGLKASIKVVPQKVGLNVLRVWSYDRAGNRSTTYATVEFEATGLIPLEKYLLNEGSGIGTANTAGTGGLLVSATAAWLRRGTYTDPESTAVPPATINDFALTFDGTPGSGAVNWSSSALDTRSSFTIAAWVDPADVSQPATVVSRRAGDVASLKLGIRTDCASTNDDGTPGTVPCYAVSMWDAGRGQYVHATSIKPADVEGEWTHLIGTYSATTKELTLWVNGEAEGQVVKLTTPPTSTYEMALGATWLPAGWSECWKGSVDDVFLAQGIPDSGQIDQLYSEKAGIFHEQ